jgi:acyl-CoA synthetase (AMP-forming)/AMP-acid ligase II
VAFVVPRPGSLPDPAELDRHVRSRLAGFKAPDVYEIRDELPKTATGKIRKFILRERARDFQIPGGIRASKANESPGSSV